jgi:hypothetical protein
MKVVGTILSLAAITVLFLTNAPAAFASNGWGLEDPQLCVNGRLLVVASAVHADVFVTVPRGADVDYNVVDCGGDPQEAVVAPDHVNTRGEDKLKIAAFLPDGSQVIFVWGNQEKTDVSKHGVATAKFGTD